MIAAEGDDDVFWSYMIFASESDGESDKDFNSHDASSSAGKDSFDSDFDKTDDDELVKGDKRRRSSKKSKNNGTKATDKTKKIK